MLPLALIAIPFGKRRWRCSRLGFIFRIPGKLASWILSTLTVRLNISIWEQRKAIMSPGYMLHLEGGTHTILLILSSFLSFFFPFFLILSLTRSLWIAPSQVEVSIVDHLRDFAPNLEKHKAGQKNLDIFFLELRWLWFFGEVKSGSECVYILPMYIIEFAITAQFFFTLALKTRTCVGLGHFWFQSN